MRPWQSREGTADSYRLPLKRNRSRRGLQVWWHFADRTSHCRGADSRARRCTNDSYGLSPKRHRPPRIVIARRRSRRGNLGKAVTVSPIAFPRSNMVLRDSHVASLLGMTNLGHCANELMPQIMPACKAVTDRRYRRNCFNAAQYGSAVRCRARHASPRLVKKVPSGLFSPSCFPNCKIKFCSMILQFCRCGGLFDAKGHPDGFLSHFPSLRNFRLSRFFDSLAPT